MGTTDHRREWVLLALLLGVLALGHVVYTGWFELAEDEAYYWAWSQRPAWGYLDHPPAIAWLIAGGTALLGDTERGVRLLPGLLGLLAVVPVASLTRSPLHTALVLLSMPLLALGGLLATPDVPLLAAWSLGLWAFGTRRWLVLGLACGLAMQSKYTGVLLLPLLVLSDARELRTPAPWLAALVAFVAYLPNVLWNLHHDGVSWRFQLSHVAEGGGSLELALAQVALVGPVLLGAVVASWWGAWGRGRLERAALLTCVGVLVVAIASGGEANWAAPAWLSGALLLGLHPGRRVHRAATLGIGINLALVALVLVHLVHPLLVLPVDPTHRLTGGKVLGESVAQWGEEQVLTNRYQEAALIAFYGGVPARSFPGFDRLDQYDLWAEEDQQPLPERGLFVRVWRASARSKVDDAGYERGGPHTVTAYVTLTDGETARAVARWQVYEIWRPEAGRSPTPP